MRVREVLRSAVRCRCHCCCVLCAAVAACPTMVGLLVMPQLQMDKAVERTLRSLCLHPAIKLICPRHDVPLAISRAAPRPDCNTPPPIRD